MIPFDSSDPLTVLLSWACVGALRAGLRRWSPRAYRRVRHALPVIAFLCAVFLRVGFETLSGQPVTGATVARAFAAASGAVFAHAQFREVTKALASESLTEPSARVGRRAPRTEVQTRTETNDSEEGPTRPGESA